jgi:hypothetical protein
LGLGGKKAENDQSTVKILAIPVSSRQILPLEFESAAHSTSPNHKQNLLRSQQVTEMLLVTHVCLAPP